MNTIDATPYVSVGDMGTLFSGHYLFVKISLRTNTREIRCAETGRMQLRSDCNRDHIEALPRKR